MSFKAFNLSPEMIASLNKAGYFNPSPVQLKAIPKALKGETELVQSSTGSGKTLCYLIPILERLEVSNKNLQSVIISPTRELAVQIFSFLNELLPNFNSNIKAKLLRSGQELSSSLEGIKGSQIIVSTPTRLKDVINNKELGFSYYDMSLSDEAFEHLVITMSPLCSPAQRVIVESLCEKYAPKAKVVESNLLGKVAK